MGRHKLVAGVAYVSASKPKAELVRMGYSEAEAETLHSELQILFGWRVALTRARAFLRSDNRVSSVIRLSGYLDFSKRVWWHVHDFGLSGALPLIRSDRDLYVSWGYDADVLASLARLQGVNLTF